MLIRRDRRLVPGVALGISDGDAVPDGRRDPVLQREDPLNRAIDRLAKHRCAGRHFDQNRVHAQCWPETPIRSSQNPAASQTGTDRDGSRLQLRAEGLTHSAGRSLPTNDREAGMAR